MSRALGEASRRRCVRGALGPALPARPPPPRPPRAPSYPLAPPRPAPATTRAEGGSDAPENACQFSRLQLPIVRIDYDVLIYIYVVVTRRENVMSCLSDAISVL
ncbi:unnamed protein product, partial [Brenthis ino]